MPYPVLLSDPLTPHPAVDDPSTPFPPEVLSSPLMHGPEPVQFVAFASRSVPNAAIAINSPATTARALVCIGMAHPSCDARRLDLLAAEERKVLTYRRRHKRSDQSRDAVTRRVRCA